MRGWYVEKKDAVPKKTESIASGESLRTQKIQDPADASMIRMFQFVVNPSTERHSTAKRTGEWERIQDGMSL